ncbi:MAG: HlyD family efflux transporter periplasmic adaptor subunit [Pricia sp.]
MDFNNKDFLGRPPGKLTGIGMQMVAGILGVVFIASLIVGYRDVLEAQIEVMPVSPPVIVKTKRQGQISKFLVRPGDSVLPGQTLARFKDPADHEDLKVIQQAVAKKSLPEEPGSRKPFVIGTLQDAYSEYVKAYHGVEMIEKFYDNTIANLMEDTIRISHGDAFSNTYKRLQTARSTSVLVGRNHSRMKTLYGKGVISKSELEKSQLEYNRSLQQVNQLNSEYVTDTYSTNEKFGDLFTAMEIASMNLLSEISLWEEKNLLVSPVSGRVYFLDVRSPYQWVDEGEELFGVVPDRKSPLIGIVKIPIHNAGNVREGQQVIIKLHSFPFEEWGILRGIITEISASPKRADEEYYPAYVKIDSTANNLKGRINGKGTLSGRCDIILEESTIFKKLFMGLRKNIDNY